MLKSSYKIEIRGLNLNRLIKEFNNNNIKLFNYDKKDNKTICFCVGYNDYKKIKNIKILSHYDFQILERYGIIKFIEHIKLHLSFFILMLISIFMVILFSKFTFKIDIIGLNKIDENEIRLLLKNINISEMKLIKQSNIYIEQYLKKNNDKISLVSVAKKGTNLIINIKEKIEEEKNFSPITAPYNMQITKLLVNQGTAQVKIGDYLKKGDVIVTTNTILTNGNKIEIEPIAEIEGVAWISGNVEFKEQETQFKKTGRKIVNSYYSINNLNIFKKTYNVKFEKYDKIVYNNYVFNNFFIPIKLHKNIYYELKPVKINRNFNSEKDKLIKESKKLAYKELPLGKEVIDENTTINKYDDIYNITTYLKIKVVL